MKTFIVIFKIFSILVDCDGVAVSGLTSLGELDDESLKLCDIKLEINIIENTSCVFRIEYFLNLSQASSKSLTFK